MVQCFCSKGNQAQRPFRQEQKYIKLSLKAEMIPQRTTSHPLRNHQSSDVSSGRHFQANSQLYHCLCFSKQPIIQIFRSNQVAFGWYFTLMQNKIITILTLEALRQEDSPKAPRQSGIVERDIPTSEVEYTESNRAKDRGLWK